MVAYALGILDLPVVHRGTLRSMLPAGAIRNYGVTQHLKRARQGDTGGKNVVSKKFQDALRSFEDKGWAQRGSEFVLVKAQADLLEYGREGVSDPRSLALAEAVARIHEDLRTTASMPPQAVEARRQELLALKRIMEDRFGSTNWSGRGSVRFVGNGRVL